MQAQQNNAYGITYSEARKNPEKFKAYVTHGCNSLGIKKFEATNTGFKFTLSDISSHKTYHITVDGFKHTIKAEQLKLYLKSGEVNWNNNTKSILNKAIKAGAVTNRGETNKEQSPEEQIIE